MAETLRYVSIVDGDTYAKSSLRRILLQIGIPEVEQFDNGEAFLRYLENDGKVNLLLIDLMLPKMTGLDVIKSLKNYDQCMDIPVIIVGSQLEKKDLVQAINLGAIDYLIKPFNLKTAQEKVKKAVDFLQKPNVVKKYLDGAVACIKQKRLSEATLIIQALLDKQPNNTRALYYKGYCEVLRGNIESAVAPLRKCIEINASYLRPYSLLFTIHTKLGQTPQAIAIKEKEITENPNDFEEVFKFVLTLRKQNKEDSRIGIWLEHLYRGGFKNAQVYYMLGCLYQQRDERAKALKIFEQLFGFEKTANVALKLIDEYLEEGEDCKAKEVLDKTSFDENDPQYQVRTGELALISGKLMAAETAFGKLLTKDAGNLRAIMGMARTSLLRRHYEDANIFINRVP